MRKPPPRQIYLLRHGETAWSKSGKHTGLTDVPLTENGIEEGKKLGKRLKGHRFAKVFSSPVQRALNTCKLCGYDNPEITDDLLEWDYGDYEGITTSEIQKSHPGWNLFKDGCPNGETFRQITKRADHLLQKLTQLEGDIALFTSGHISRVICARFLGLDATEGRYFYLSTAALSILSYENGEEVVRLWNDTSHLD